MFNVICSLVRSARWPLKDLDMPSLAWNQGCKPQCKGVHVCSLVIYKQMYPHCSCSLTIVNEQLQCGYSLVPSPTPSFSSLLSTVKRGGPGTFPHVSDVKGRKG